MLTRICAVSGFCYVLAGLALPFLPNEAWSYVEEDPRLLLVPSLPFGLLMIYSHVAFQTGQPQQPILSSTANRIRLARLAILAAVVLTCSVALYAWSVGPIERRQSSFIAFAIVGSLLSLASTIIVAHWVLGASPLWPEWFLRLAAPMRRSAADSRRGRKR